MTRASGLRAGRRSPRASILSLSFLFPLDTMSSTASPKRIAQVIKLKTEHLEEYKKVCLS